MAQYVISQHHNTSPWQIVLSLFKLQPKPTVASSATLKQTLDRYWRTQVSLVILGILQILRLPYRIIGTTLELLLNTLSANGGFFRLVYLLISGTPIRNPSDDPSRYYSLIGHLDWRTTLDRDLAVEHVGRSTVDRTISKTLFPETKRGPLLMAELCVMSSKLAYENAEVIERIVKAEWKMDFVGQYDCWNEGQRRKSTHVFIFTDRAEDANVVVVAFRGTEPFNTYNWSTDLDFSWYELPVLGRVHVGFLEALGLGDRNDLETFVQVHTKMSDPQKIGPGESFSGLSKDVIADEEKLIAFDVVTTKVKEILQSHKNAKLYITGHSLGGALACLYPALLFCKKEDQVTDRLDGVYTFGQPRVGGKEFSHFMDEKLCAEPRSRYFRVVYCSDLVPRVPFDDHISQFKHSGLCWYFDSFYTGRIIYEEPNKNYFSLLYVLPMELYAIWELIFSFFIAKIHGRSYRESGSSTLFRVSGLLLPGVAAHSPVNYVNAVRLGIKAHRRSRSSLNQSIPLQGNIN
ncbi:hypothetical protein O6H91_05G120800 [Diphasiastrum complanatum]|uniref:Uncharacterized protein n=1 Tax=Diphasiastrum complanatum TaxID=34168 RepID=A0ACC2DSZ0_DIPCM|nr:hypothetical protein O6H91_05G120800 [Diphasiastrum complanatum]